MFRIGSISVIAVLVAGAMASAQSRDRVYYRDRSVKPEKNADFEGTIVEETVNGVKIKPQVGPDRTFSVADLIDVAYAPPTAQQIPYQPIAATESALRTGNADRAKITQLLKDYTTFLGNIKDPKAVGIKRHITYRLAMLKADAASKREEQLEALRDMDKARKELASSWQLVPLTRRQVQLLAEIDKLDDATKVLEETAKTPGLARELKQELELTLIDLSIRAGRAADVEGRITQALTVLAPTDPMATRLKVYQIGAQASKGDTAKLAAQLRAMIDQSNDTGLKALAYNTLGDCYSAKGLKKDAMWAYLWVDVVYNQEKGEYAKAVERLSRVFKDLNDDVRAERYKEKLKLLR